MTISYKDTIRLPKTSFSMKANLSTLSTNMQKKWHDEKIYEALRVQNNNKPKFILHDGPPYANGNIHLGTALNKILKDIIVKGKNLLGFDAPLVFGWDCHGLPIEWKVEEYFKQKGISKENIDAIEFRAKCRKFAAKWLKIQLDEFQKLGLIADFDNPYITMDYQSEAVIYKEIVKLINHDNLYLGKKPVLWSVIECTALAEAEVEYIEKISNAIFVGFEIIEDSSKLWNNALAIIWTTTPWTIPGNQAIAFNPNITYGLYEIHDTQENSLIKSGAKIIIAKELANKLFNIFSINKSLLLDETSDLSHLKAKHPLNNFGFNNIIPLLKADFVDINVGSGLVHIAPAYGLDDFYLAKKNSIVPKDIINDKGIYIESVPVFAGNHIFKVEDLIISKLQDSNSLVFKEKIKHSYPSSWRSKAPLIYRLTKQWFLNLHSNDLKNKLLNTIENNIKFLPKAGKNRLYSMVSQRPDWCLSRQRLWGVPLAMFIHKDTEELLKDEETYNNIYNTFIIEGSDAWFKSDPKRFLSDKLNKDDYIPVYDVVDVWFDSGCSHVYVLRSRKELQAPADLYIEGSDQHRGWFQSSLIESMVIYNSSPYKSIITHGFVLDEKGQKMSKSLGNVIKPLEILQKYGLDVLRLWVANSDYHLDVRAGDSIFKQQSDVYRKIRNTLRYMLGNLTYFKEEYKVSYEDLPELEKLILHGLYSINNSFKKCFLETYEFHNFFNELYNFIAIDLSAFYFDIRKDALYCDSDTDIKFKSCLTVIDILFNYVVKWLSPFITVTAEEAFLERFPSKKSILLETLKEIPKEWCQEDLYFKYQYIKEIRKFVNNVIEEARINKVIGSSLEAEVVVYVPKEKIEFLQNIDLASIFITSGVIIKHYSNHNDINSKNNIKVEFYIKKGVKCQRCWKIDMLNNNSLCKRCLKVVE